MIQDKKIGEILVTGGAGYIGSHTILLLLQKGYKVVVIDNLANSSFETIKRVEKITGKLINFYEGNILNTSFLEKVFKENNIESVIHFAGLKAVSESHEKPNDYYENNVMGSLNLLKIMNKFLVKKIVFSSSATVYGENASIPYKETSGRGESSSPYGTSKAMIEKILEDSATSNKNFKCCILRYFNPIGAHESGMIGEDPSGIPNNLLPFISQVAVGRRHKLEVFGGDYSTPDGTCRRDYLHVMDLAEGHIKALSFLDNFFGCKAFNLGTGEPISVLEMVSNFEKICKKKINFEIVDRRPGDLPEFWADPSSAKKELNWSTNRSIDVALKDTWRWQKMNPSGFVGKC